ncbi:4-(cytidine 5'-diphospho)-2-C-methyl-D-erythritol kinase [Nisaea acidiphila]|uniref:4-diphosphocytidyl-2-C-methyl-D-erythritol kinase n=1 Tax=Nisaea acidiphila TaxID=1862145 RepID=A0A9J7ALC5_9PROT|nr:4-(cytidine 5'-diphospho)-2-C-methyl-D-erythritol kinase [Nisaea acidiphila]UUX47967.1 4-(cytidine 5'-diphospho)-2-C-methyl-D-erythritol kinase [Nisaea acidiphila]
MAERSDARLLLAPAKVNLSLRVLGRRQDGYHELISRVAFADLHDRIVVGPARAGEKDTLDLSGPFAGTLEPDNLILRAVARFREAFPSLAPLRISLKKHIPVAAGLGGGSADAAAMLRHLARFANCDPMNPRIQAIAATLGADVPVCLEPVSRTMRGTGTKLDPPREDFPEQPVLLVNPGVAVPTGAVFTVLGAGPLSDGFAALSAEEERNDLEMPARKVAREVGEVLDVLRGLTSPRAVGLSGSGATCFALFSDETARDRAAAEITAVHPDWWLHAGMLRNWEAGELESVA